MPIVLSGAEDGTVRIWHANTFRLESTLNYGMERVWAIHAQKGSNNVAIGYDEGSVVIKLGREEPAVSMDSSGKIVWARQMEIQQANIKTLGPDQEIKDGEKLPLAVKDLGACEIYPQSVQHNPNGRFVVVCGDGEYIIYTAMALRNKSYGSAQEFVWASDSSMYAIRDGTTLVKIFKNFKEMRTFKPELGVENIFGGPVLGVRTVGGLCFYGWDSPDLIRRIEIMPKAIYWNEGGELVAIVTEDSYYILQYKPEQQVKEQWTEDGYEAAFEVVGEFEESVKTACWVGDCFIYTSSVNRLNYFVGGEVVTVAHLDRKMYLLGYIPADNRLYLADKDLAVVSFSLLVSVLEYQTAVMRKDFDTADKVLPSIPREKRTRVAQFLEKQGFKRQALAVTTDLEHKFELAVQLGELNTAFEIAQQSDNDQKWRILAELATANADLALAEDCLRRADDASALALLASSTGDRELMAYAGQQAAANGHNNIAFMTAFALGDLDRCLELLTSTGRLAEAAFFAHSYKPSEIPRIVTEWKEAAKKQGTDEESTTSSAGTCRVAEMLADPTQYDNLFPQFKEHLSLEESVLERQKIIDGLPARMYSKLQSQQVFEDNDLERLKQTLQSSGPTSSTYIPPAAPSKPSPVPEPVPETSMATEIEKELEAEIADLDLDDENFGSDDKLGGDDEDDDFLEPDE